MTAKVAPLRLTEQLAVPVTAKVAPLRLTEQLAVPLIKNRVNDVNNISKMANVSIVPTGLQAAISFRYTHVKL